MSQVTLYKCKSSETTFQTLLEHTEAIANSIFKRALILLLNRDCGDASRDAAPAPVSKVTSVAGGFRARIPLHGFEPGDIQVSAMPDALVIHAHTTCSHEGKSGDLSYHEISGRQVFRRIDFPASVDVDRVTAFVDNGVLEVTVWKAKTGQLTPGAALAGTALAAVNVPCTRR
jgi:HSP20 family molecular chaperone IbpA